MFMSNESNKTNLKNESCLCNRIFARAKHKSQNLKNHRSSHLKCSMEKGVLKNFTKFTGL